VQLGTVPCKECAGQAKSQSCDSEQSIGRLLLQGVRRVECLQHLDVVEDLPQGVHARSSLKDLRSREQVQEV
jgi:hypothetical protein